MPREVFVEPVMRGGRYQDNAIPVAALPELAIYGDVVLAIARVLFLRDHPGRKRVPKNFSQGLDLKLKRIDAGSAIPVLERVAPEPSLGIFVDHFLHARDLLNEAIDNVSNGNGLPNSFPRDLAPVVARLGSGLLDDESIEFRAPGASAPRFGVEVRKKFITLTSTRYEQPVEVTGIVEAVDLRDGAQTFRVRSDEHGEVEISLQAGLEEAALDFAKYKWPIVVKGVGDFAANGKLLRIRAVSTLELGDNPQIEGDVSKLTARLEELRRLQRGWLDGVEGEPMSASALKLVEDLIGALSEQMTPKFYAFPTPQGGARLEWELGAWDASVESNPAGTSIAAHALNLTTGEERNRTCATSADIVDFVVGL